MTQLISEAERSALLNVSAVLGRIHEMAASGQADMRLIAELAAAVRHTPERIAQGGRVCARLEQDTIRANQLLLLTTARRHLAAPVERRCPLGGVCNCTTSDACAAR